MSVFKERVCDDRSYIGELAHCIGFDSDVVLLELLFDLIDACGDVLGLRADKREDKQQTPDQIRVDWQRVNTLPSTGRRLENSGVSVISIQDNGLQTRG